MWKNNSLLGLCLLALISVVGIQLVGCDEQSTEPEVKESVVLLEPSHDSTNELTVAFRWRIENRKSSKVYCSDVITARGGVDVFDEYYEEIFHAMQNTQLVVSLDQFKYEDILNPSRDYASWGVRVYACTAPNATCQDTAVPCQGEMFRSEVRSFYIQRESVELIAPANRSEQGLAVTFRWSIKNKRTGVVYCSSVITDKGSNPLDGSYEDLFYAGEDTQKIVYLPQPRYDGFTFQWAIVVTACTDPNAVCGSIRTPDCRGRLFESDIWYLRTKK